MSTLTLVCIHPVRGYRVGDMIGGPDVVEILANPEHARHVEGLTIAGAVPATGRYFGKPRFWYGAGAPPRDLGGPGCHYADATTGALWIRGRFGWRETGAAMRMPSNPRAGMPTAARARPPGMDGEARTIVLAPGQHAQLAEVRPGRQLLSILNTGDGTAHFGFDHPPVMGESWTVTPSELLSWCGDVLPDPLHAVSTDGTTLVVMEGF